MKYCKRCDTTKTFDSFYQKKDSKDGLGFYCKACHQELHKHYRKLRGSTYNREWQKDHRKKRKARIVDLLGGKCTACGLVDDPVIYDLHHLNPEEKDVGIGEILDFKWETIEKELQKCVLLCANCHRKIHFAVGPNKKEMVEWSAISK